MITLGSLYFRQNYLEQEIEDSYEDSRDFLFVREKDRIDYAIAKLTARGLDKIDKVQVTHICYDIDKEMRDKVQLPKSVDIDIDVNNIELLDYENIVDYIFDKYGYKVFTCVVDYV